MEHPIFLMYLDSFGKERVGHLKSFLFKKLLNRNSIAKQTYFKLDNLFFAQLRWSLARTEPSLQPAIQRALLLHEMVDEQGRI